MNRPLYCNNCGSRLTLRRDLSDSWETYDECCNCKLMYRTTYGDPIGGSETKFVVYKIDDDEVEK